MTGFSAALLNPAFYAKSSPTKGEQSPTSTRSPTPSYSSLFPRLRATTGSSLSTLFNKLPPKPPLGGTIPHWSDEERIWISRTDGWKWQTWGYDSSKKEWRAWLPKKAADRMGSEEAHVGGKWVRFAAWPEDDGDDDDPFFTRVVQTEEEMRREMSSATLGESVRTMSLAMLLDERSKASLRSAR